MTPTTTARRLPTFLRRLAATALALGALPAFAAVPGVPYTPTAEAGDGHALISIVGVADNGGSPITGYVVESQPAQGEDSAAGTLSTFRAYTGLSNGQTYTFTVRAINADGTGPASAPSAPLHLPLMADLTVDDLQVAEGTGPDHVVRVPIRLGNPLPRDVTVGVGTIAMQTTYGEDIESLGAQVTFPAGTTVAYADVTVHADAMQEPDEDFWISVSVPSADLRLVDGIGVVTLVNDDTSSPLQARHDRLTHHGYLLDGELTLLPAANDVYSPLSVRGGSLTIVEFPEHGLIRLHPGGDGHDPTDDPVGYLAEVGYYGEDRFTYRLCDGEGRCSVGEVTIVARALPDVDMTIGLQRTFSTESGLQLPEPRVGTRWVATPLFAPTIARHPLAANLAPERIWDRPATAGWTLHTLAAPPGGQPRRVNLLVEASLAAGGNVDLYVGVDDDGDGGPDLAEVDCGAAMAVAGERCVLEFEQAANTPIRYWTMAQNLTTQPAEAEVAVYEVPAVAGDHTLYATGPGIVPADTPITLKVGFDDPTLLRGETRAGFLQLVDEDGRVGPATPVKLGHDESDDLAAYLLQPGKTLRLRLAPGETAGNLFFEVPAGVQLLRLATVSANDVDLELRRYSAPEPADYPTVFTNQSYPVAASAGAGGNEEILRSLPVLGRYLVRVANPGNDVVEVDVRVDFAGTAPIVRPGSYFNPGRPGSGLFLSPAGGEIAGLWYTYLQNRRPTWYYLQAAKPGANGVWNSDIYRSAWDGQRGSLQRVGRATIAPVGNDRFRFAYMLEGHAGSQVYEALGRGCPAFEGAPLDISSQWFDPATAGSGYSVQMWPTYEFFAAFVYDQLGEPRFLAAELDRFGGAEATLDLEQLNGECPTCDIFAPVTVRQPAGTLTRTIAAGSLARVQVDANYTFDVPGLWDSDDTVQLLGGPGTAQGCEP